MRFAPVLGYDPTSGSWHPVRFPVQERDDIALMTGFLTDATVEVDEEELGKAQRQVEQLGAGATSRASIGTTGLMEWIQSVAGPEGGQYLLADFPSEVEALFEARGNRFEELETAAESMAAQVDGSPGSRSGNARELAEAGLARLIEEVINGQPQVETELAKAQAREALLVYATEALLTPMGRFETEARSRTQQIGRGALILDGYLGNSP